MSGCNCSPRGNDPDGTHYNNCPFKDSELPPQAMNEEQKTPEEILELTYIYAIGLVILPFHLAKRATKRIISWWRNIP